MSDNQLLTESLVEIKGKLFQHEPLAKYTSWHVGGPADYLYKPANLQDCQTVIKQIPPTLPLTWLGLGSNSLIRDAGIRGVVMVTQGGLGEIKQLDAEHVYVQAGVTCAKVAKFCARAGLGHVGFLAGVPGTMGGALAMNAGCFGGETWEWVERVETIDRNGVISTRDAAQFTVGYRHLSGLDHTKGEKFIAAVLKLKPIAVDAALAVIRDCLAKRNDSQPTGVFCGGSVFKNPEGDYAGRLIEACDLKGYRIGGAIISKKHANFILNDKTASANDIEQLILTVKECVSAKHGVELQPEVKILGDLR